MRMIQNPLTPPTTLKLYSMAKDVAAISGRAFGDVLEDMVAVLDSRNANTLNINLQL